MPEIRLLEDFLRRIQMEGGRNTPFTWLIGAGMSVSSNIPLATNVSWRIILFEYLSYNKEKPWLGGVGVSLNYHEDLEGFLDWYNSKEENDEPLLSDYQRKAQAWFNSLEGFQDMQPSDTNCYPLIFKYFFQDTTIHHYFLTNIIKRAKGVNIAHLALAGLLRDYPLYGQTVFTTNFDDLLLKAILYLNYTARVYGDLESHDKPVWDPTYPQIIHLHGRHTGYRLVNTKEQLNLIDPAIQDGFRRHISNSHLVVLGYSGWDDFVMHTLQNWKHDGGLIKGNLFWIPYKSEERILPQVRNFFDECPPGRVHIIVNKERNLDADSFMLNLTNTINISRKGFEKYRIEILNNATTQHQFTMSQLEQYPTFSPNYAVKVAEEMALSYYKSPEISSEDKILEALNLIKAEDVSRKVKADALWFIGIVRMMKGNYANAIEHFKECLDLRGGAEVTQDRTHLIFNSKIYRALGECHLKQYDIPRAKDYLDIAYKLSDDNKDDRGFALAKLVLAQIAFQEGKLEKSQKLLSDCTDRHNFVDSPCIDGEMHRLRGDISLTVGQYAVAIEHYKTACSVHQNIKNEFGVAAAYRGAGRASLFLSQIDEGLEYYTKAMQIYNDAANSEGLANIEQACGDYLIGHNEFEQASKRYAHAVELYSHRPSLHGLSNVKFELLRIQIHEAEENSQESVPVTKLFHKEIEEIVDLCQRAGNKFVLWQLMALKLISKNTPKNDA